MGGLCVAVRDQEGFVMVRSIRAMAVAAGVAVLASASQAFIQDASILIDKALNSPVLTVKYKGASVSLVELKINGVSFNSRAVSPRDSNGETNFTLDTAALIDGENTVEVCLYDSTGKLVGTQKTRITADRRVESPVLLDGLKSGATVTGPIEIKVGLKREFKNMYVSFFVNDEFKTLKNFPPYSYFWDTTRLENGWYDLEAWVVDENNSTFKTPKTRVFVNNPGGRTDRRNLDGQQKIDTPVDTANLDGDPSAANLKPAQSNGGLGVMLDPIWAKVSQMIGTKPAGIAAGIATGPKSLTPTGTRMAVDTKAAITTPKVVNTVTTPVKPTVAATPKSAPVGTKPISAPVETVALTTPKVTPAVAPKSNPVPPVATIKAATNVALTSIGYGTRLPNIGTFSIMLDNKMVNFDSVLPRVVAGVPLTPFRYLFEQAGGSVNWADASKAVTAKGQGRTIAFKIGDKTAMVNEVPYSLELAPFIDRGRSVVPMSFLKDTLDVRVDYDPKTGHVLITSVEKTAKK